MQLEYWHDDSLFVENYDGVDGSRILSSTSGNIQRAQTTNKVTPGEENSSLDQHGDLPAYSVPGLPLPQEVVVSDDSYIPDWRRLASRRLRKRLQQRLQLAQQCVNRDVYLRYRNRARKDVDKATGQVIWTDEMEEAFTNAIINIPPMGRRKRSQHGRAYGRNELIKEWILRETGQERDRKQISSHIQVLDKVFKPYPEWWRLLRCLNDKTLCEGDPTDYYENSIEDMVRNWPHLRSKLLNVLESDLEPLTDSLVLKSNDRQSTGHRLDHLDFEMWLSPSNDIDQRLHMYTQLQSDKSISMSNSLEDLSGWRKDFPDLERVVSAFPVVGDCDIALLNVNFKLVTHFPPGQFKLGIKYDLEFSDHEVTGDWPSTCLTQFRCITSIYERGKTIKQSEEDRCLVPERCRVKPLCESKWWAQELARLTVELQSADETGESEQNVAAEASAKRFLQGLTMMQQIFSNTDCSNCSGNESGVSSRPKRIAILLWKFSQAPSSFIGTTTWRRLVLPVEATSANKCSPRAERNFRETNLAPSRVAPELQNSANEFSFGQPQNQEISDQSISKQIASVAEDKMIRESWMMSSELQANRHICSQPNLPLEANSFDESLTGLQNFEFNLPLPTASDWNRNLHYPEVHQIEYSSTDHQDLCHVPQGIALENQELQYTNTHLQSSDFDQPEKRLARFDAATHYTLQTQLEGHEDSTTAQYFEPQAGSYVPPYDQTAISQTNFPAVCEVEAQNKVVDGMLTGYELDSTATTSRMDFNVISEGSFNDPEIILATPTAVRPPFQQHHSFTGVLQADSVLETPRRAFTRMIEQMEAYQDYQGISDDFAVPLMSSQILRSHSQPPPEISEDVTGNEHDARPVNDAPVKVENGSEAMEFVADFNS